MYIVDVQCTTLVTLELKSEKSKQKPRGCEIDVARPRPLNEVIVEFPVKSRFHRYMTRECQGRICCETEAWFFRRGSVGIEKQRNGGSRIKLPTRSLSRKALNSSGGT